MKFLVLSFFVFLAIPSSAKAQGLRDFIKETINEAAGPPGRSFGDKSHLMVVKADGGVTFIFLCSAGKENGAGDKLVNAIFDGLNQATAGVSVFFRSWIRREIEKGVVNEGDAFCGVFAKKTGGKSKARNVRDGSIYTTSWRNGEKVQSVTDERACKKVHKRYFCFEVAEGPSDDGEIDGVSGCFEAKVDGRLVSFSFGRGETIPVETRSTFGPKDSKSSEGCVVRKLGVEKN